MVPDAERPTHMMLTEKQLRVLRFFRDYRQQRGISPTLEEAAQALGVSKITIHEHLRHLEEKKAIQRDRARARAVAVLFDPDEERNHGRRPVSELPILGVVAAGRPIEAVEHAEVVPLTDLVPTGDDHYVLRVQGKSMIEDHIDDGDYVVIKRQATARNGDIVVAVVDGEEATLKRYYYENGRVRLQPANSALSPIFPERCEIRGVLKGVVRKMR
ncbi:MAG: transcriptional repressor LexA [Planctomycetes bacterium]|nr:transcriptional repressor LexA [Planctomycetota bacterium]